MTTDTAFGPILANILDLISEESGVDAGEISSDQPLVSSGLLDSFALVTVLSLIEDQTEHRIDPADLTLDNFDTLDRMAAFLERLQ